MVPTVRLIAAEVAMRLNSLNSTRLVQAGDCLIKRFLNNFPTTRRAKQKAHPREMCLQIIAKVAWNVNWRTWRFPLQAAKWTASYLNDCGTARSHFKGCTRDFNGERFHERILRKISVLLKVWNLDDRFSFKRNAKKIINIPLNEKIIGGGWFGNDVVVLCRKLLKSLNLWASFKFKGFRRKFREKKILIFNFLAHLIARFIHSLIPW